MQRNHSRARLVTAFPSNSLPQQRSGSIRVLLGHRLAFASPCAAFPATEWPHGLLLSLTTTAANKPRFYSLNPRRGGSEELGGELKSGEQEKKDGVSSKPKLSQDEMLRFVALAAPYKKNIILATSLLGFTSAISLSLPMGIGYVVDLITNLSADEFSSKFLWGVGPVGAMFGLGALANYTRVYLYLKTGLEIVRDLRLKVFDALMKQDMAFFDKSKSGELITRLSADTTLMGKALTDNLSDGLRSVAQAIMGVSMMLYLSPKLSAVLLVVIPPVALLTSVYGRFVKNLSRDAQNALAESSSLAEESMSQVRVIQAFEGQAAELERYRKAIAVQFDIVLRESRARALFYAGIGFAMNSAIVGILGYGGMLATTGLMTMGDITSFLMYTTYVAYSLGGLSSFYTELMKGMGASTRIWQIVDTKPHLPIPIIPHVPKDGLKGFIEFKNVSFAFPLRPEVEVLQKVSFSVKAGSVLALVGSSGSGKSTVAQLLVRLYDPSHGAILLDGVDLKAYHPSFLRSQIGYVPQDPMLFSGSIAENIRFGKPNATDSEVYEAARAANVEEFSSRLPDGINTVIGQRGHSLSGGQRQRVAIARALIRNPKILLLDEYTSALDGESEALVLSTLRSLMASRERTILIIAHRLRTIRQADMIAVLSGGHVVETGTYEALSSARNSVFSRVAGHTRQSHASPQHTSAGEVRHDHEKQEHVGKDHIHSEK